MNRIVNTVSGRLSLRPPQRRSLDILDRICEIVNLAKDSNLEVMMDIIQSEFSSVTDFEREFPSLCFALATGVGKTRLMGAFIAYLYLTRRSQHFFILAPNLTIYNKLITDFTAENPKYVFQGISEFTTTPPIIITGDNYESGVGVREEAQIQRTLFQSNGDNVVHINIFNISKINKEERSAKRLKSMPRIKRLSEYIGESYFDYLAGLPDLVVLMDEAHRYRADAGMKAINELQPILGLELTATPFTEVKGKKAPVPFGNVIYSYSLAEAITDGFVKEPAVATRKNFDANRFTKTKLEQIKLEDGVRLHEQVKTDLQIYAAEHDRPIIKPFMLVIAQDTDHASRLIELFKSDTFFEGYYADRVIEVHSALKGEEKEETVERLLAVENPKESTEVVIHVNMLKEGWDVTNLYTIVPLRAANARTLVEQSIGRGLRLPYGRKTGVKVVDRLTIVAHDKFQEIVDEANRGDSIIHQIDTIILNANGAENALKTVPVLPFVDHILGGDEGIAPGVTSTTISTKHSVFTTPTQKAVAKATLTTIVKKRNLTSAKVLLSPEEQEKLVQDVRIVIPKQGLLEVDVEEMVKQATEAYVALSIDIPAIAVVPTGKVTVVYEDFDLDTSKLANLQPVTNDILVQHLRNSEQEVLSIARGDDSEQRLEDYLVRALIDFDDVDYGTTADLLYGIAKQLVIYLWSYLPDESSVRNVLQYYQGRLGRLVHAQMVEHRRELVTDYEVKVLSGHRPLQPIILTKKPSETIYDFRKPVSDKYRIAQMLFGGFIRCLYPLQKFHSDSERRFAVLLETDPAIEKWVKPARANFQIQLKCGKLYEPDFVVEAVHGMYLCEVKRSDFMKKDSVLSKANAAAAWCKHATYIAETDAKSWRYLLIPAETIKDNIRLEWFAKQYEYRVFLHIPRKWSFEI